MIGIVLLAGTPSPAATYYWDNNGDTPGFGTAAGTWAAPTMGDATQGWSSDATGATLPTNLTTTTSDAINFGTATIALTSGTITVSGTVAAGTLTFGSASEAITLSGGVITLGSGGMVVNKAGQVIGSRLTVSATRTITAGTTGANLLALNGVIGGAGGLTFTTANANFNAVGVTIKLGATNTYSGSTTITIPDTTPGHNNSLTIQATIANALPPKTVLILDGYAGTGSGRTVAFDLNGKNQTVGGLTNVIRTLRSQRIINSSSTAATLTISNTTDHTFSGQIYDTDISLVKRGTGTQTLSGGNLYTGTTTIENGTLELGRTSALSSSSNMILAGGTLEMGSFTNALGTLTLTGNATLALGGGTLSFKESKTITWTGILTLTGTIGEKTLRFGTNASALTHEQLHRIRLNNQPADIDANGYIWIPPEGTKLRLR